MGFLQAPHTPLATVCTPRRLRSDCRLPSMLSSLLPCLGGLVGSFPWAKIYRGRETREKEPHTHMAMWFDVHTQKTRVHTHTQKHTRIHTNTRAYTQTRAHTLAHCFSQKYKTQIFHQNKNTFAAPPNLAHTHTQAQSYTSLSVETVTMTISKT